MTAFQQKYPIVSKLLTSPSKRRSGQLMNKPVFIVAHDTGNPKSTARQNVSYYENSKNEMSASAHLFVDDKEILECVPALMGTPEKAWHVLYNVETDNKLYGVNANDAAIGVEYCYGGAINADESYRRYVWVMAYICFKFNLDPRKSIVGHFLLDPKRKTDPVSGLAQSMRTYDQMLRDVVAEFVECGGVLPALQATTTAGKAKATVKLNIRKGKPSTRAELVKAVTSGTILDYTEVTHEGEAVNGNPTWYKTAEGDYFWSGGTVSA
jgi:N-acetylmuramoyl-L-alanine amidase